MAPLAQIVACHRNGRKSHNGLPVFMTKAKHLGNGKVAIGDFGPIAAGVAATGFAVL
ncbi:MAG: hypothetical protein ACR2OM_15765 [Aestuariivirgaceae bacterium]